MCVRFLAVYELARLQKMLRSNKSGMHKEVYFTEKSIQNKSKEFLVGLKEAREKHPNIKFEPKRAALLVLDMQRYFLNEESHAFVPRGCLDRIGEPGCWCWCWRFRRRKRPDEQRQYHAKNNKQTEKIHKGLALVAADPPPDARLTALVRTFRHHPLHGDNKICWETHFVPQYTTVRRDHQEQDS